MIPEQAIEAAKEAMREVTPPPGVSKADWLAEHGDFALIAGAIAAAAPHMLAEAWDEGNIAGIFDLPSEAHATPNPYRSQAEFEKQRKYAALTAISELGSDDPDENPYRSQA